MSDYPKSWAEVTSDYFAEESPLKDRQSWGNWRFSARNLTLTYDRGYEIDLETIHTSAEMLDWIFQIAGKTWGQGKTVSDLIAAFNDIFNPQASLCSGGIGRHGYLGKVIQPKELIQKRIKF